MRRIPLRPIPTVVALAVLASAGPQARSAEAQNVPERFENLRVLPKDIPRDTLIQVMRSFSNSLGVRCSYCHVGQDGDFDFASDDKDEKEKARFMMRMTRALNAEYLPRLPDRREPPVPVGCVTCHRGLRVPTTLDRVLAAAVDSGGAPAAVARYRQLREQSLERGRYDFGEGTLGDLARRLAAQGKTADAVTLLELNAEFHPNSGTVDFQLAELHRARGERDRAIARYRMALEKQPDNPQARRRLDELTGTTP